MFSFSPTSIHISFRAYKASKFYPSVNKIKSREIKFCGKTPGGHHLEG